MPTWEELKEHTAHDKEREEYLSQQLQSLENETTITWTVEELAQALRFLIDDWYTLDSITRKQTIGSLFKRISINTPAAIYKGGPGNNVPVNIVAWDFKDHRTYTCVTIKRLLINNPSIENRDGSFSWKSFP